MNEVMWFTKNNNNNMSNYSIIPFSLLKRNPNICIELIDTCFFHPLVIIVIPCILIYIKYRQTKFCCLVGS